MTQTENKTDKKNLEKLRAGYQSGTKGRDLTNNNPTAFNNVSKKVIKHSELK